MKFVSILMIVTLVFITSPISFGNTLNLKPKKVIVELTIPGFGITPRIEVPIKKRRVISGGGGTGVSHPTPETLKSIKIWSFFYNVSLLKQKKDSDSMTVNFGLSYEANGSKSINEFIEIKAGELKEVEFQDGIKLKVYVEGTLERAAPPNNSFNRSGISMTLIVNSDAIRRYFPPG